MPRMTSAELLAYEARLPVASSKPIQQVKDEAQLHEQILGEIRRRGWIAFHGSMAHRTFRTPGEPDFVIMLDGGRWLAVEVKTATGKLSVDQQAIHAWAAKLGHQVHVVRSLEEFIALL